MKIVKKITSLILSVFLISGCQQNQEFNRDIYAMDTYINVSIYANNDSLLEEVENKIYELENLLSITNYKTTCALKKSYDNLIEILKEWGKTSCQRKKVKAEISLKVC